MRTITLLGATGSIGQSTLEIIRNYRQEIQIHAVVARSASDRLVDICAEFTPEFAMVDSSKDAIELQRKFRERKISSTVLSQQNEADTAELYQVNLVVTGIVGAAGLRSTLDAVRSGCTVLIANKEPVVMLGPILAQESQLSGATILPIDSELNAIFQCICSAVDSDYSTFTPIPGLKKVLLTASGGPFLSYSAESMKEVQPEQAISHPVWKMGAKISVDSATLANKGLEIIEARWLFNTPADKIEVIIHPQGIVHSMVEFLDGSILAQMGTPDMRIPITHALFWPLRKMSGAESLNLLDHSQLTFQAPDYDRFQCLKLAREIADKDTTAPAIFNSANEIAVEAFLNRKIQFVQIADVVDYCIESIDDEPVESVEQIIEIDAEARATAINYIDTRLN